MSALPSWKSAEIGLFRPFPDGLKRTSDFQKTEEKGLFPQISSDLLKPPSLKPPFAALQTMTWRGKVSRDKKYLRTWSAPSGGHIGSISPSFPWPCRRLELHWSLKFGCVSLLTIEVFLHTVRLFYLRWGTARREDQIQCSDGGNRK